MTNIIDITTSSEVLHEGLAFGEGPRFHNGSLYFSDMHAHQVLKFSPGSGTTSVVVHLNEEPSGLGWLPNGDMLIVGMSSRSLLTLASPENAIDKPASALSTWADLSALAPGLCNDMVVMPNGGAYVGNFGYDMHAGEKFRPTDLIYVSPQGSPRHCASELVFPNGAVVTADGKTMIIAETFAGRLTSFAIDASKNEQRGALSDRQLWAELPDEAVPDGICLDTDEGVWVASPTTNDCLRVIKGGQVTHRVALDRGAFACMLGGEHLYILAAKSSKPDECKSERSGQLLRVKAPFKGAGYP